MSGSRHSIRETKRVDKLVLTNCSSGCPATQVLFRKAIADAHSRADLFTFEERERSISPRALFFRGFRGLLSSHQRAMMKSVSSSGRTRRHGSVLCQLPPHTPATGTGCVQSRDNHPRRRHPSAGAGPPAAGSGTLGRDDRDRAGCLAAVGLQLARSLPPGVTPRVRDGRGYGHVTAWDDELRAVLRSAVERPPGIGAMTSWNGRSNLLRQRLARWDGRWWSDRTVLRGSCIRWATSGNGPDMSCSRTDTAPKDAADPPAGQGLGAEGRPALRGRDGRVAVPAVACLLGTRGKSAKVVISGRNARHVLFGAINVRTGHRLLLPQGEYQKGEDFREFLLLIHDHYRGWPVWLLLDEDSSHAARGSVAAARGSWGSVCSGCPKHVPELNAMDHVWGHAKDEVCANHQEPSIEHLVDRFIRYIQGLSLRRPNGRPVYYRRTSG